MKKKFSFLLVLAVLVMGLSACGSSKSDTTSETKATKAPKATETAEVTKEPESKTTDTKGNHPHVHMMAWSVKPNQAYLSKDGIRQIKSTLTNQIFRQELLHVYEQKSKSRDELVSETRKAMLELAKAMRESLTELKQMEKTLNGKKELQRQVLAYSKTRPVRDGLKQQKNAKAKAAYRQKYESDFIIADAAARYFRENGISKLPSYKALQAEIETLIQEKNSGYNDYRAKREEYRRLQTVKGNIDQILHRERKPVKRQEQER